jgi:hypothetical protein
MANDNAPGYTKISTTDLMARWNDYGADSSLVVYLDRPQQITSIYRDHQNVVVVTNLDAFLIPRSDVHIKMWPILAGT